MKRLTYLLICLLLSPLLAQAADPPREWQLDILVFERTLPQPVEYDPSWAFSRPEWLPEAPATPTYSDFDNSPPAAAPTPAPALTGPSALRQAAQRLNASGGYRVLAEGSWRVAAKSSRDNLIIRDNNPLRLVAREALWGANSAVDFWLSAPDLAPPVDIHRLEGRARFAHDYHPILEIDLSYVVPLAGMQENQIDPDGRREYFRDQVQQFPVHGQRALKPGQPAYFDHFRIGVLAQITPLAASPETAEPAE